ncbi:MAG: helix-turn-helix domain-containing protein [Phycisphaeraceae bacterium]
MAPTLPKNYLNLNSSGHFVDSPSHHTVRDNPLDYLLIWVLGGRGFAACGGQSVQARPGHLLLFPPGVPQEYGSDQEQPWDIVWVHFAGAAADELVRRLSPAPPGESPPMTHQDPPLALDLGLDANLHERFTELVVAHATRSEQRQLLCNCLLWGLLGLVIHRLEMRGQVREPDRLPDVQRLQAHIHEHLTKRITSEDLAHVAGLSVSQLNRVFQKLFHQSPMQYVTQQRIAKACLLLSETGMPIKAIAGAVGCDDPYYFSRLFHRQMGMPPSAYRQQPR